DAGPGGAAGQPRTTGARVQPRPRRAAADRSRHAGPAGRLGARREPRMTTGVLLMAYGTPATPADIEAYYTHIRRGRRPTGEQLADLRRRYDAIGGTSPLLHKTQAQALGLQRALGDDFRVVLGMKHAPPF